MSTPQSEPNSVIAPQSEPSGIQSDDQESSKLSDRPWWATFGVAVGLIVGWLVFNATLFWLADDGDNESVWGRYVYLLAGIEAVVFVVIGWLFGVQATRGAVAQAQKAANDATKAVGEAKRETEVAKSETKEAWSETQAAMSEAARNARDADNGRSLALTCKELSRNAKNSTARFLVSDGRVMSPDEVAAAEARGEEMSSAQLASLERIARQLFPDV